MSNNDSFSSRMGIVPPKAMQVDNLDKDACTALYNAVDKFVRKKSPIEEMFNEKELSSFYMDLGTIFFKIRYDMILQENYSESIWTQKMENNYEYIFYLDRWYRIFDFIEFIYPFISKIFNDPDKKLSFVFSLKINEALKQENVGYRFADGKFIPVTNDEEIQAIEQATASPFDNASNHINKAITLFADRKNPDYANSIKESISAVESLATEVTAESNFDKAIGKLQQQGVQLHPQFKAAIKSMYRFTSDEDGIRHGGTKEPLQCNQATARYMLIICSAMVNFIAASQP